MNNFFVNSNIMKVKNSNNAKLNMVINIILIRISII